MLEFVAWMIVVSATSLTYSLAFTPFSHMVGYGAVSPGGYVRSYVECPTPVSVLLFGPRPSVTVRPGACVPPSRTLALEAGIVAVAAGALVWKPLRRPPPESIEPLSNTISLSADPRRD